MRAIALAIMIAGFGIEIAIRNREFDNLDKRVNISLAISFITFTVCLILGI